MRKLPQNQRTRAKRRRTTDGLAIIDRRFFDTARAKGILEEARAEEDIARKIRELRESAGLSQRALAKLVGTSASAINRLEDADYEGHSLSMLRRIAAAVGKRVDIRFLAA
jgi:ribosome-binding protein aMBF1 (putative translation factor)